MTKQDVSLSYAKKQDFQNNICNSKIRFIVYQKLLLAEQNGKTICIVVACWKQWITDGEIHPQIPVLSSARSYGWRMTKQDLLLSHI